MLNPRNLRSAGRAATDYSSTSAVGRRTPASGFGRLDADRKKIVTQLTDCWRKSACVAAAPGYPDPALRLARLQVADVTAVDAARGRHPSDHLTVAAVQCESDPSPLAIVAANCKSVRAPAGIRPIDGDVAIIASAPHPCQFDHRAAAP
jgi:hypothetical protein